MNAYTFFIFGQITIFKLLKYNFRILKYYRIEKVLNDKIKGISKKIKIKKINFIKIYNAFKKRKNIFFIFIYIII